jgi:hypothetical protein
LRYGLSSSINLDVSSIAAIISITSRYNICWETMAFRICQQK